MHTEGPATQRELKTERLTADLCVVGGGLAGTCCAITAARAGIKVVLVQDRPVLGGNASSEVRLWALGATAHMGSNNRWAREGGVIDEIMVENFWRNPEGNPLVFDTVVLEKVVEEPNLKLLLNTAAFEVIKADDDADRIQSVRAFCSQNSTMYEIEAPLFCDASGDGVVGFLSGAAFRMGAESKDEFNEGFAPTGEFGYLLGHSIYFYSKDVGRPVKFTPPSYALDNVPGRIPRFRRFNAKTQGCSLWWIEYGGRLDTIHETENIKWELWKVVYGVWDYIKNSGKFPEADTLTLEWVGHIPGKRESRRFEGEYMLVQDDVIHRRYHEDAVAFGGWSIDLHPADGVFSEIEGSHHLYFKGPYTIPYRCYFSRNIENLFMAGRVMSASHVAFGSTRVMCTCAHGGQAVGEAAALCVREGILPREVVHPRYCKVLQRNLLRAGQHIPGFHLEDPDDLAKEANITASSRFQLGELPDDGPRLKLENTIAQLFPASGGEAPTTSITVDAAEATTLKVELRTTSDPGHHTPDVMLSEETVELAKGKDQTVRLEWEATLERPGYLFLILHANEAVSVHCTSKRITGMLTGQHRGEWDFTEKGGERFDAFTAFRRPQGHNLALSVEPAVDVFRALNVNNGLQRPTNQPNAWVAGLDESSPSVKLDWDDEKRLGRIEIFFDVDYDHALETVQYGHPDRAAPFCVRHYIVRDAAGNVLHECDDNHQSRNVISLDTPVTTGGIEIECLSTHVPGVAPAAIFEVRCYEAG